MGTSGIGFHILYEQLDHDAAKNKLIGYLQKINPRWINIMGGARRDQAFLFARQLREQFRALKVVFRNWPDDGNNVKDYYVNNPALWVEHNKPYLETGFTVLTDNESVTDDMHHYADWSADIMDICGKRGWSVAVGRFAVGNVQGYGNDKINQYAHLDEMWKGLAKWGDLHIWSPNEYFDPTGKLSNGLAGRYLTGLAYNREVLKLPAPTVLIGEYGVVYRDANGGLDAGAGYKDPRCNVSGRQAARLSIDMWKERYRDHGVDVSLYAYGDTIGKDWYRFRIDDDDEFMTEIVDAAQNGELEPIVVTAPPVIPQPPPIVVIPPVVPPVTPYTPKLIVIGNKYRLTVPIEYVNVRSGTSYKASIIGAAFGGEIIEAVNEQKTDDGLIWVRILTFNNLEGWISSQFGRVKFNKV